MLTVERTDLTPIAYKVVLGEPEKLGHPTEVWTAEVILADSWSQDSRTGTITFRDRKGRIVGSYAMARVMEMYILNGGPMIWAEGRSIHDNPPG